MKTVLDILNRLLGLRDADFCVMVPPAKPTRRPLSREEVATLFARELGQRDF